MNCRFLFFLVLLAPALLPPAVSIAVAAEAPVCWRKFGRGQAEEIPCPNPTGQGVFRCVVDGRTVFQSTPCPATADSGDAMEFERKRQTWHQDATGFRAGWLQAQRQDRPLLVVFSDGPCQVLCAYVNERQPSAAARTAKDYVRVAIDVNAGPLEWQLAGSRWRFPAVAVFHDRSALPDFVVLEHSSRNDRAFKLIERWRDAGAPRGEPPTVALPASH